MDETLFDRLCRTDRLYPLAALGLFLLGVLGFAGYSYVSAPTSYTLAVAPHDGVEQKLMSAFADSLREERRDVRINVKSFEDVRESARALQEKRVELAVVRPDVLLPTNGLTIAILREEALIVVAPATNGIVDFEDLAGKRLGVLGEHEADFPAIGSVLSHYALNQSDAIPIRSEEIGDAIATKRVDAIAFLAPPISDRATRLVRAVLQVAQGRVNVVPITQADALALKTPALGPTTIPPGALSGRPQTPERR